MGLHYDPKCSSSGTPQSNQGLKNSYAVTDNYG